jgi:hypothetical protein
MIRSSSRVWFTTATSVRQHMHGNVWFVTKAVRDDHTSSSSLISCVVEDARCSFGAAC